MRTLAPKGLKSEKQYLLFKPFSKFCRNIIIKFRVKPNRITN